MEEHNYNGLWKLTLLCACMQVVPLAFVGILPASTEEQLALQKENIKSPQMGKIFVSVVAISLLFVVIYSIVVVG